MSTHTYGVFVPYKMVVSTHMIFGMVPKGTVIEYDGTRVRLHGREEVVESFAGVIRSGWAVLAEETDTYTPPAPATGSRPMMEVVDAGGSVVREGFGSTANNTSTPAAETKGRLPVTHDYRDVGSAGNVRASTSAEKAMSSPTAKTASVGQLNAPTASTGRTFKPEIVKSYEDSMTEISPTRILSPGTKASPESGDGDGVTVRVLGSTKTTIRVDDKSKVDWDLGTHYKKRVQKALEYKASDPDRYNRILNVETPQVRAILEATEVTAVPAAPATRADTAEDNVVVSVPRRMSKTVSKPIVT